jgi:hypothetical protein
MRKAGAHQLLVEQSLAVPNECQKTIVPILSLQTEGEPHVVVGLSDKIFRESTSLGAPRFYRKTFAHGFRRVDALQPHSSS